MFFRLFKIILCKVEYLIIEFSNILYNMMMLYLYLNNNFNVSVVRIIKLY